MKKDFQLYPPLIILPLSIITVETDLFVCNVTSHGFTWDLASQLVFTILAKVWMQAKGT